MSLVRRQPPPDSLTYKYRLLYNQIGYNQTSRGKSSESMLKAEIKVRRYKRRVALTVVVVHILVHVLCYGRWLNCAFHAIRRNVLAFFHHRIDTLLYNAFTHTFIFLFTNFRNKSLGNKVFIWIRFWCVF